MKTWEEFQKQITEAINDYDPNAEVTWTDDLMHDSIPYETLSVDFSILRQTAPDDSPSEER